jgi:type III secretion protein T
MENSIIEYPYSWLTATFFSIPRLLAMFSMLPMFNRQALPGLLRIGVAFGVGLFEIPLLQEQALHIARSGSLVFAILMKEAAIGFLLGFIIALPLWALDIMGAYVDNQRGASIAASINPLTGHDTSPLGELFSQAGIVFLLISGGMSLILGAVYDSFLIWPVFELLPKFSQEMPTLLLDQMDRLMSIAVLLGAPVIFSMFLAEIGLGMVSRFVPQLQVFFLAMPVKSGLAMFVFAVYATTLFGYAGVEMDDIGQRALRTMQAMFR